MALWAIPARSALVVAVRTVGGQSHRARGVVGDRGVRDGAVDDAHVEPFYDGLAYERRIYGRFGKLSTYPVYSEAH